MIGLLLATFVGPFVVGSFAGYLVHRLLHDTRAGTWAKSHNAHHTLYSPEDFEDTSYRSAGKDDSNFVFVPLITVIVVVYCMVLWFLFNEVWIYPVILTEGVIVGYLNDKLHEAFHLRNHWLNKYSYFRKLKYLHWIHHLDPSKNHAIIWFGPDRMFGTFRA